MRWWLAAAAAVVLAPAGAASAEEEAPLPEKAEMAAAPPGETVIREEDKVVYEKETKVNFNDGNVDGELTRPDGDVVRAGRKVQFESMIQQRRDFNKELRESIDE